MGWVLWFCRASISVERCQFQPVSLVGSLISFSCSWAFSDFSRDRGILEEGEKLKNSLHGQSSTASNFWALLFISKIIGFRYFKWKPWWCSMVADLDGTWWDFLKNKNALPSKTIFFFFPWTSDFNFFYLLMMQTKLWCAVFAIHISRSARKFLWPEKSLVREIYEIYLNVIKSSFITQPWLGKLLCLTAGCCGKEKKLLQMLCSE